ncbi:MAG: hypothetical protein BJ554DRAFT_2551, partial [Olpidium bornovanus]
PTLRLYYVLPKYPGRAFPRARAPRDRPLANGRSLGSWTKVGKGGTPREIFAAVRKKNREELIGIENRVGGGGGMCRASELVAHGRRAPRSAASFETVKCADGSRAGTFLIFFFLFFLLGCCYWGKNDEKKKKKKRTRKSRSAISIRSFFTASASLPA